MKEETSLLSLKIRNIDLGDLNKFLYQTAIDTDDGSKAIDCIEFNEVLRKFKRLYLREYPGEISLWFKKFNHEDMDSLMKKHGYEFEVKLYLFDGTPKYGLKYTGKCEIDCIYKGQSLLSKWKMDELLVCLGNQSIVGDMNEDELIAFLHEFSEPYKAIGLAKDTIHDLLDIRHINNKLKDNGVPYIFDYDETTTVNRTYRIKYIGND